MRSRLWLHGMPPALGVVAVLQAHVVSKDARPSAIAALVVVALVRGGMEAWQAARTQPRLNEARSKQNAMQSPQHPTVQVRMSASEVQRGSLTGMRMPTVPDNTNLDIMVGRAEDATITGHRLRSTGIRAA